MSSSISSGATIQNGKKFTFQAGDEIYLKENFSVQIGASFEAIIKDCTQQNLLDIENEINTIEDKGRQKLLLELLNTLREETSDKK